MERISDVLCDTPRECAKLNLSVSWRCPKSVIYHAQEILEPILDEGQSTIEPAPHAPDGEIRKWGEDRVYDSLTEEDAYPRDEYINTMFLCRTNAPLFGAALGVISKGIPAIIRERDICKNILDYINDENPEGNRRIDVFMNALVKRIHKIDELEKASGNDFQVERDKIAVLDILAPKAKTIKDLKKQLEKLFNAGKCSTAGCDWQPETDDEFCAKCMKPKSEGGKGIAAVIIRNPGIIFSTIHKSKGLEALKIFLLDPTRLGRARPGSSEEDKRQEIHLHYVAVTRTKFTKDPDSGILTYVLETGSPDYEGETSAEFDPDAYEPLLEPEPEIIEYKFYVDPEFSEPFVYPPKHKKAGTQVSYVSRERAIQLIEASKRGDLLYCYPDPYEEPEELEEPPEVEVIETLPPKPPRISTPPQSARAFPSVKSIEEIQDIELPSLTTKGRGKYEEPTLEDWKSIQVRYLMKGIPAKLVALPTWGQYALIVNAVACSSTTVNLYGGETRKKGIKALRVMQPNSEGEFALRQGRTIKRTGGWHGRIIGRINEIILNREPSPSETETFEEMADVGGSQQRRNLRRWR